MIGLGSGLVAATLAAATPGAAHNYGEGLLDTEHGRHPALAAVRIVSAGKEGTPIKIDRIWGNGAGASSDRPLQDANGQRIGTLHLVVRCGGEAEARAIANDIGRRIYLADVLAEPDPFVPGARRAPRGQALVDEMIASDPALVTIAIHVTPPGEQVNRIVASSFGRVGKVADADDAHVIRDGAVLREMTNGGRRVAVELPLLDRRRRVIGALSTSFSVGAGDDVERLAARAVSLRDRIALRTRRLNDLFRPATVSRQVERVRGCR